MVIYLPGKKTLHDIEPAVLPQQHEPLIVTEQDVIDSYKLLLEVTKDESVWQASEYRIADLQMIAKEREQTEQAFSASAASYQTVIDNYLVLLTRYPVREGNDQLLYQLSKAYDLQGQVDKALSVLDRLVEEFPDTQWYNEAQFRRGDILFSKREYAEASRAYNDVVKKGEATPYYLNALYMLGWSAFKRNQYDVALVHFSRVLDALLLDAQRLASSQEALLNDVLRVTSIMLAEQHHGRSLAALFKRIGERPYEHQVYQALGDKLISQERYIDMVETFRIYIEHHPLSLSTPQFNVRIVKAYEQGHFYSRILPEKEQFVTAYGIRSDYWVDASDDKKIFLKPYLKRYLNELAQTAHAKAQREKAIEKVRAHYLSAANWYTDYIDTFPQDEHLPDKIYLLADVLFEAQSYQAAIAAYQRVAYQIRHPEHGEKAAYGVIAAYGELIKQLKNRATVSTDVANIADHV